MKIYHLLSSDNAINDIALKRVKVSRYSDLNDPFELMGGELSDKTHREFVREVKNNLNKSHGLICFSRSWSNPVLWSHYADKHRGVALGFEVNEDHLSHIKYSKSRVKARFKGDDSAGGLESAYANDLLHTKYKHWEYEEESRLQVNLATCNEEGGLYFSSFDGVALKLVEVILGYSCNVPINAIKTLVSLDYENVKVRKARLAFKKFEVVTDQRYE